MARVVPWLEEKWERHSVIISIIFSVTFSVLYFIGVIENIRYVLSDVIAFTSIVVGINGVFITLVISIKLTPAFQRLKKFLPSLEQRLFVLLKKQVMYGLTVVLLSIIIIILPYSPSRFLSFIGVSIWAYFFISMAIGTYFTMNLIINIILANEEDPKASKRS